MVQWLGLGALTSEILDSFPGWGNKIPQVMGMAKKKRGGGITLKHLFKEDIHMDNKHMRRCSTSLVIRKMQTTPMRYHPSGWLLFKKEKKENNKCWHACGETRILIYCW